MTDRRNYYCFNVNYQKIYLAKNLYGELTVCRKNLRKETNKLHLQECYMAPGVKDFTIIADISFCGQINV